MKVKKSIDQKKAELTTLCNSLSQELSIMALFDERAKLKITHDVFMIKDLKPFEVLSTSYRKIKELFRFSHHYKFYDFLEEHKLCYAITEVAFTHLDVDKLFLDELKPILGEEQIEKIKKKPSAKILFDEKLKISSHLIICKNIIEK